MHSTVTSKKWKLARFNVALPLYTLLWIMVLFCSGAYVTMSLSEDITDNNDFEVAAVLANGGQ